MSQRWIQANMKGSARDAIAKFDQKTTAIGDSIKMESKQKPLSRAPETSDADKSAQENGKPAEVSKPKARINQTQSKPMGATPNTMNFALQYGKPTPKTTPVSEGNEVKSKTRVKRTQAKQAGAAHNNGIDKQPPAANEASNDHKNSAENRRPSDTSKAKIQPDDPNQPKSKTHFTNETISQRWMQSKLTGSAANTIAKFNKQAESTEDSLKKNPFSETYEAQEYNKRDMGNEYGRPPEGTKTRARGIKAGDYVVRELIFLCEVISQNSTGTPPDCVVKFGPLFYIYNRFSGSLVGMLVRARKYGLVDFEGEMLYQGQDDEKGIRLLKPLDEIRRIVTFSGDPSNCVAIKK
ncbi:costars domain-containing protein [Ditylenchus destructor]|uniref:Costars domain-containing protein n=1 Tax=Ditylenchus destructor TaxID=166010 RepID=A0AAD4MXJ2_9BILA|nr:costars domain-containing protein [Ditylenchus destructor]